MSTLRLSVVAVTLFGGCAAHAAAQPMAPQYSECRLDSIFPNGGQRGTSVKVRFQGVGHGMSNPKQVLIDGPGGIAIRELKSLSINTAEATLEIAPDASLGRRWLRVVTERAGVTNFAHFVVSGLPEQLEVEPNDDVAQAQFVATTPTVLNGRIDPQADRDVFKFRGRRGEKLVAAIAAHAWDIHGQYKNYGIADFNLELLDPTGLTLASAEDTIGFDPLIEYVLPSDGDYMLRVQLLSYGGFPEAVYRLTIGETPYPTAAFPAGYQLGSAAEVEWIGPHLAPGTKQSVAGRQNPAVDTSRSSYPLRYVAPSGANHSGLDLPLMVGAYPEVAESEPNDERSQTKLVVWPTTINGRFQRLGDADWYRVKLEAQQKIWFETHAHRFIRSPVDTLIQVYDANGVLLGENDDEAFEPGYECYHDYKTTDSKLLFTAPAAGEFLVRVSEQSGVGGPRAIYRLTIEAARPEFRLTHFPDAAPVWGPGSTAGILVRVDRFVNCDEDIDVTVEGLPDGWSSSSATSLGGHGVRPYNTYQLKVFVTVTAPADSQPGTSFPYRIVGRARRHVAPESADSNPPTATELTTPLTASVDERTSIPLTLFYTSDTGFFRASPVSRVAVAKPQGPWLERMTREISLKAGESGTLQVRVLGAGDEKSMPLVVNVAMAGVACTLTSPQVLPIKEGVVEVPIRIPPDIYPGTYGVTVAQTWGGDIRVGMPGPCTPLITLKVLAK